MDVQKTLQNLERFRLPYTRGNPNGEFCIVGEAPGEDEQLEFNRGMRDTAFVGSSGSELDKMLHAAQLPVSNCYFTNVYKSRPPGNKIKKIDRGAIESSIDLLRRELASLPNLKVIVPVGNLALQAVTDIQTIRWKPKEPDVIKELAGIGNWRGSIVRSVPLENRPQGVKTIPTFHPAFIMRQWKFRETVIEDFERVKEDAKFDELRHPEHNIITSPSLKQTLGFIEEAHHVPRICTDIENKGFGIFCLGIALNKKDAICIPFELPDGTSYWSVEDEAIVWRAISKLFKKQKHVGQFYFHDAYYYHHYGLIEGSIRRFNNMVFDTFGAHVCLYGELPHTLAYMVSIYTRNPYYKDEGREWKRGDDIMDFWLYNGKDVCLTEEVAQCLEPELEEFGKTEFYKRYYLDLFPHLLQSGLRGTAIDETARKTAEEEYRKNWVSLQHRLQKQAGLPELERTDDPLVWKKAPGYLNVEAHKKLKIFLSEHLGRKLKNTRKDTLKKLVGSCDSEDEKNLVRTVLEIKSIRKTKETYLDPKLGHDGRFHFTLKYSTETGRLAGQKDPFGFGANPQTIPDGICRSWVIADPGFYLIYADLSQAEARIVAWLSGCSKLIKMFEEADAGGICDCGSGKPGIKCCKDIHKMNAANIFSKPVQMVTYDERQLGKKIRHARNYMMGARTFSANSGLSEMECRRLLRLDAETYPEIPIWWGEVRKEIMRTRMLSNPMGRQRIFFGRPWDDATLREALAFIPQSTVPDIVNLAYMHCQDENIQVLTQMHDALLNQAPTNELSRVCKFTKESLEIPFYIHGIQRVIPADLKVGKCWDGEQMFSEKEWIESQCARSA